LQRRGHRQWRGRVAYVATGDVHVIEVGFEPVEARDLVARGAQECGDRSGSAAGFQQCVRRGVVAAHDGRPAQFADRLHAISTGDSPGGILDSLVDAREDGGRQRELEGRAQREPLIAAMVGKYTLFVQHGCTKSATGAGFQLRDGLT